MSVDLEVLRHDAAHILAQAVQELFPETKVAIGPVIEDGFYYDFERSKPFELQDLEKIEARMHALVDAGLPIVREEWSRQEALAFFAKRGETYKVELVESIPEAESISVYKQGPVWLDLCRGPHGASTAGVGHAFKLIKLSAAYWRGDSRKASLQRIYGTAWPTQDALEAYLTRLRQAHERDHRVLGKQLDFFHFQEEAAGCAFWHPKGFALWQVLEQYMRRILLAHQYKEVKTPQLLSSQFWEKSGHWDKFRANMFVVPDGVLQEDGTFGGASVDYLALKPMNCPAHVQIFKRHTRSYRELPLRLAEFGCCHRNEASGALHGLMRVRQMTQDDAHIFCTSEQILSEARAFTQLLQLVYGHLGFHDITVKFSTRPQVRAGDDQLWEKAEFMLEQTLKDMALPYEVAHGEGAFYGPKLEFHLKDVLGRSWQCGTFQLDFVLPERLDASYITSGGNKERPVMLHRAILGTFERFIAILIEHYAGKLPMWLAPVQVNVATITSAADAYAHQVVAHLSAAGLRVQALIDNEKIHYKARQSIEQKVPILLAVGKRDMEQNQVTLRPLDSDEQIILSLAQATEKLCDMARPPA